MYFDGNSPHQTVMIECEYIICSHISDYHNMRNLCWAAVEKVSSNYREDRSKAFQGRKNTQDECNKIATQTKHT